MTESYLHYLWSTRRYQRLEPIGILSAKEIEVLDPGILNRDAGPDFFNAKIRIDDIVWVGNVELHKSSAEWYQHKHHLDARYESVVLHVVLEDNATVYHHSGTHMPTCLMHLPEWEIVSSSPCSRSSSTSYPCSPVGERLSDQEIYLWLELLSRHRLQRRTEYIRALYEDNSFSWPAALYILLVRYFGFGLNNDAMEALAKSLPLHYLLKERSQLLQIESLILGQAGIIESFPEMGYRLKLSETYAFLRHKYQLKPLDPSRFIKARTRPANHPLPRMLQLAWLLYRIDSLHTEILLCTDLREVNQLFNREVSPTLAQIETQKHHKAIRISHTMLHTLTINVVIPYQLSYAHAQLNTSLEHRATNWFASLAAEQNRYTKRLTNERVVLRSALDSQAAIELHTHYCELRKCHFCPWGRALLSQTIE